MRILIKYGIADSDLGNEIRRLLDGGVRIRPDIVPYSVVLSFHYEKLLQMMAC